MYKRISAVSLLAVSSLAYALTPAEREAQELENIKMLQQAGVMAPNSGVTVVPRATLKMSQQRLKEAEKADEQRRKPGYISSNTASAQELIAIQSYVKKSAKKFKGIKSDESTDIRPSIADIKLAFEFKGVPKSLISTYIGTAPQGSFHENGWSGAAEFFSKDPIGNCSYGQMSIKVSHLSAELATESVSYEINNKVSVVEVIGNKKSGFLYNIKWFDDNYFYELECANMSYSPKTTALVINLAKDIDNG